MTLQELPNGSVAQPLPAGAANKAAAACGASQEPLDSDFAAGASTGCPKGCADTVSQPSQPLPVFDLAEFLAHPPGEPLPAALVQQCAELAACLERTGALLVRDPRVSPDANDALLDLLEAYFSRPDEVKAADARPELAYQVGATPGGVELPRCVAEPETCAEAVARLAPEHRPTLPTGPDVKWRFFWRIGSRPESTDFPELNAQPVVPQDLPGWSSTMDAWGSALLAAARCVAAMAALGWGLPIDSITQLMDDGPHLLAPTGSNLAAHGTCGTVLAGYHADLNLLTIHGRSRFPGLNIWLADGTRLAVSVPEGCLLLQAGRQLEWLTGGAAAAGMHEVVVGTKTLAAVDAARAKGRPLWRVSSTVFAHVASDAVLRPLGAFADQPRAAEAYPPTSAGLQVRRELEALSLARSKGAGAPGADGADEGAAVQVD